MAVPVAQLVKRLEDIGILTGATLQDFIHPKSNPKDAEELLQGLLRQKKLTKFQAEQVWQGKGKSLVLGNYLLLDKIGEGGMGAVYKAEHRRMHRIVAIKMLPAAMIKDPLSIARFEREVTAAARLRHPHIVAADDADEAGGVHFLVMEYVDGSDLAALVKKNGPCSVEQAVNYMLQAARGLEYAHSQGVVHRDIKPANLLLSFPPLSKVGPGGVALQSGDSAAAQRIPTVKILDMGLARVDSIGGAAPQAELTSTGAIMGTVDYMPPEQAMDTRTADARADIYSLGCSLFYLLTGRAMYHADTLMKRLMAHRELPIPSLQAIRPEVPDKVEAVYRKMVAKRVEDRYQTATEVIGELEACLAGTAVSTATGDAAFGPLASPFPGSGTGMFGSQDAAVQDFLKAISTVASATDRPVETGPTPTVDTLAGRAEGTSRLTEPGSPAHRALRPELRQRRRYDRLITALAGLCVLAVLAAASGSWIWEHMGATAVILDWPVAERAGAVLLVDGRQHSVPQSGAVRLVGPPGRRTVQLTRDGYERIDQSWDLARAEERVFRPQWKPTAELLRVRAFDELQAQASRVVKAAPPGSPSGETPAVTALHAALLEFRTRWAGSPECLAAGALVQRIPSPFDRLDASQIDPSLRPVWGLDRVVGIIGDSRLQNWSNVTCLAFSSDGRFIAAGSTAHAVKVWDVRTGAEKTTFNLDEGDKYALAYRGVRSIAFSPDGATLAAGSCYAFIALCDALTGERRATVKLSDAAHAIAFSSSGRRIACGSFNGTVAIVHSGTGEVANSFSLHMGIVTGLCFSEDERSAVSCGVDGSVKVWDTESGMVLESFAHEQGTKLLSVALRPGGKTIAAAGSGPTIRLWSLDKAHEPIDLEHGDLEHGDASIIGLAFDAGGQSLMSVGSSGTMTTWDVEMRKPLKSTATATSLSCAALAPNFSLAAGAGVDPRIRLWDLKTGDELLKPDGRQYSAIGVSPDCRVIAVGSTGGKLGLWSVATSQFGELIDGGPAAITDIAFSPDGTEMACGGATGQVKFYTLTGGMKPIALDAHQGSVARVRYSPDGKFLLTAGDDRAIRIWDAADRKLRDAVFVNGGRVSGLAASTDGRLFAGCSGTHIIELGSLRKGQVTTTIRAATGDSFYSVVFNGDGTGIFAGQEDLIRSWKLASGRVLVSDPVRGHTGGIGVLAVSCDGKLLVSAGWDGTVQLWEIGQTLVHKETIRLAPLSGFIYDGCLATDGRHFVTRNANGAIYILRLREGI